MSDEHISKLGGNRDLGATISRSTQLVGNKTLRLADISVEVNAVSMALQGCDTEGTLTNIGELTQQINHMGESLKEILEILASIQEASKGIGEIADLTNVLSLNASIQAARSGEVGQRFAVVANEVKSLADRSKTASSSIAERLKVMIDSIHDLRTEVDESVGHARTAAEKVSNITEINDNSGERLVRVGEHLKEAFERENQLLELLIQTGQETEHTPFVQKAIETASLIGWAFEEAIEKGEITEGDLFSEKYTHIAGTNPEQFTTPYTDFTDRILPPIQEPVCGFQDRVAFCAAVRTDSFLPTHILKVSQPQRLNPKTPEDVSWNDANCRTRRFFRDPTGMAAGKNTNPILVRVYDRKLGDQTVIMYDASAPIHVKGRHWGGVRLGYKAEV